jgi:hypothetical protein
MQIFELTQPKKSNTLVESVCRDLTRDQRRIVEGMVRDLRPLFETTLTTDQIQQIFQQAQQKQAAQGGAGRTAIGKAVDATKAVGSAVGSAAGAVNDAIDKLGGYLHTTTPVKYFDDQFDELKRQITAKLGADSKTMAVIDQLGQYARANPGKTAFVIGALTAVAAFSTGPAGGAVAGQVLRGAVELLKGENLSTAVGKGAKSAAIGGALGAGITALGDYFGNIEVVARQIPGYTQLTQLGFHRTSIRIGGNNPGFFFGDLRGIIIPSQLAPKLELLIDQTEKYIDAGNWAGADRYWKEVTAIVDNPEVRQAVKEIAGNNQKLFNQAVADAANFKEVATKISSTLTAAVQGGIAGASAAPAPAAKTPAPAPQVKEGYTRLTNKEIREIFAIAGGQLTEGPTWDKIKSVGGKLAQKITNKQVNPAALLKHWEYANRSDDSGIIATILRSNNVSDNVIQDIFGAMNIEVNTPASNAANASNAASGGSQTNTATTATAAQPAAATAAQPAAATAAQPAAPAMNTNQILKSYEMMTPAQRAQLIKDLEIIDDRDRLATGTNESRKRQRKI